MYAQRPALPAGKVRNLGNGKLPSHKTSRLAHGLLDGVKAAAMRLQRPMKLRSPQIQEYDTDHGHHMIQAIAIQRSENVYADRLNR